MKFLLQPGAFILFLAMALLGSAAQDSAPEDSALPETPSELKELLSRFVELRAATLDTPLSERIAKLDANYTQALDRSLAKATDAADLDAALELREELERIRENKPLDSSRKFETSDAKRLAATYVAAIQGLNAENVTLKTELALKLGSVLEKLQSDLTRKHRFEDALAVKNYLEGDDVLALLSAHEAKLPQLNTAAATASKVTSVEGGPAATISMRDALMGKVVPPTNSGGIPATNEKTQSGPTIIPAGSRPAGRIVILSADSDSGTPAHDAFAAVAAADKTDIVAVGRTLFPNIGAIQSDGALVYWANTAGSAAPPVIVPGDHVACCQSNLTPFIGLRSDGTLSMTGNGDPLIIAGVPQQSGITDVAVTAGAAALIHRDTGKVTILGRSDHPNAQFLQSLEDVRGVTFSGLTHVDVLTADGSVVRLINGQQTTQGVPSGMVRLREALLAEDKAGRLHSFGSVPDWVVNKVPKKPIEAYLRAGAFAALDSEGGFHLWLRGDNSEWTEQKVHQEALRGSLHFAILDENTRSRWIVAILPPDAVPHSGAWDPTELRDARIGQ